MAQLLLLMPTMHTIATQSIALDRPQTQAWRPGAFDGAHTHLLDAQHADINQQIIFLMQQHYFLTNILLLLLFFTIIFKEEKLTNL